MKYLMIILFGLGSIVNVFSNSDIPILFVETYSDSNSINLIKKNLVRYASQYHLRFIEEDIAFLVNIQINKEGRVILVRLIGEDIPIKKKAPFELFVRETLILAVGKVEEIAGRNFTIPIYFTHLYNCRGEKKEEIKNRVERLIDEEYDDSKYGLEDAIRCVYVKHKH